ncbi:DoxX family protein [Halostella sp. PRR32]|uniref:DoxX family protein n=1 Tax=Halostella sp. PRR32 TaxID=3098147 RepID=UPI002B1E54E0|nr:DoxX family protein [Halostella sp. PRR32]
MSVAGVAALVTQTVLGLVGLVAGGAKVTHQEEQVDEFRRYGYPQWFRIGTGLTEIGAGIGLIAGLVWTPELTAVGALLLSGVTAGAVMTHIRIDDPPSKTAVPAAVFLLSAALLATRPLSPV